MNQSKTSYLPGIFLIILGGILLIHQLDIFYFSWSQIYPVIFLLLGLYLYASLFTRKSAGAVFWGTVFFLLGLFFSLRNYDIIDYYYMYDLWPILLLIFGIAFIALFILKPEDWGVLIPAGILLFFGSVFLLRNLHLWQAQEIIEQYWPIILILIGLGIISKNIKKKE